MASGPAEKRHDITIERMVEVPAKLAFRSWAENTLLHPDQIRRKVGHRLVVFTWQGSEAKDSVVELEFVPKGANACQIQVRHLEIPDQAVAQKLKEKWEEEVEALAAHALAKQDVPTLEIQVLPDPKRFPRSDKN
jgi:hypothetical protein